MTQHTPPPWETDFKVDSKGAIMIYSEGKIPVAIIHADKPENLAFIVKAVNCHEELVRALKEISKWEGGASTVAKIAKQAITKVEVTSEVPA